MSERYEVRGSYIELFSVFDTELKMTLCSACFPEDANKIATALNAAPQAEKAREIIERAEEELTRAKAWVGDCYLKAPPEKAAPAMQCMEAIDQLLADIAAHKEG